MINTYIFDFDGTLVDSKNDVLTSLLFAFNKTGESVTSIDPEIIMQRQLPDAISAIVPGITRERKLQVIDQFVMHYDESGFPTTTLMPTVSELLDTLKEQSLPCFIVSNKRRKPMLMILEKLGIMHYFKDVLNPDTFPGARLTKSALLAHTIKQYALNSTTTAYIGDMEIDVSCAKENGLQAVFVRGGYGNFETLSTKPDLICNTIIEIVR